MDYAMLPKMIDISCVKADIMMSDLEEMVALAKQYRFICCFAMPSYTQWLIDQLRDEPDLAVGGAIGFPSGADMAETKAETAARFVKMGCKELDMVLNISALKNADYQKVREDILGVRRAGEDRLMKVILEVCYLTDDEIKRACEIALECGADFVKTGTGWGSRPCTVDQIRLMKQTVGDAAQVKAAGGVRTLKDIEEMTAVGCTRFGIGVRTVKNILKEAGMM